MAIKFGFLYDKTEKKIYLANKKALQFFTKYGIVNNYINVKNRRT